MIKLKNIGPIVHLEELKVCCTLFQDILDLHFA